MTPALTSMLDCQSQLQTLPIMTKKSGLKTAMLSISVLNQTLGPNLTPDHAMKANTKIAIV